MFEDCDDDDQWDVKMNWQLVQDMVAEAPEHEIIRDAIHDLLTSFFHHKQKAISWHELLRFVHDCELKAQIKDILDRSEEFRGFTVQDGIFIYLRNADHLLGEAMDFACWNSL